MAGEQAEEFEVVIRVRSRIPKKRWAERLYPVITEIRDLEDALSKLYQLDYSVSSTVRPGAVFPPLGSSRSPRTPSPRFGHGSRKPGVTICL